MKEFWPKDPMDKVNRKMLSVNTSQCLRLQCLEHTRNSCKQRQRRRQPRWKKEQWTWRSICRRGKRQAREEGSGSQVRGDARRSCHFTAVRIQVGRHPDLRHWKDRGWGKKSRNHAWDISLCQKIRSCSKNNGDVVKRHRSQLKGADRSHTGPIWAPKQIIIMMEENKNGIK